MQKTLIATALSAVFAAPAFSAPTVYGNFRGSINLGDLNGDSNGASFVNNASRLGVKGSLGNDDLQGIYHLQMGANNDAGGAALSSRFYFAGLKGSFGKVIYGRLSTPYKMAGVKQDPFYDTSAGPANGGSNYGYSGLNNGFTDNTIAYYSSKFGGGFTFNATLSLDDTSEDDHDAGIGVEYATKTFKVGASLLEMGDLPVIAVNGGAESAVRLYGSTKVGSVDIGASFESVDFGGSDNAAFFHLNGKMKMNDKTSLVASFGTIEDGAAGAGRNSDGTGFAIGAYYNILPKTTLSAIFTTVDYDDNAVGDRDGVAFGVIQKF